MQPEEHCLQQTQRKSQKIYVPNLYHILILLRYIIKLTKAHKTVIELQQHVRTTKRMWFFLAQKAAVHDMC